MLITIVTVVFNGEKYIEQTIQSVLAQEYREIEYIMIDGGSTDGTLDIINRYASRFAYWVSETDNGIADAMNKGILRSSGRYIFFLHADDYISSPSSIRRAVDEIHSEDADLHSFPIYFAAKGDLSLRHSRGFNTWINFKTGFYHQGVFFHRDVFRRLGLYDTTFRITMDYEYFLRAYRLGATVCMHDKHPVAVMRDTGVSSGKDWDSLQRRFQEEKRVHTKHARSRLIQILYAIYWPAYVRYRLHS